MVGHLLPGAEWYYALATVSFVVHIAATGTNDILKGDFEPSQTTYSSAKDVLAVVVVVGILVTTVLLIPTIASYVMLVLDLPTLAAAVVAAYYPVGDLYLQRRGFWTPTSVAMFVTVAVMVEVVNIHQSVLEAVPVVGRHRRPQS